MYICYCFFVKTNLICENSGFVVSGLVVGSVEQDNAQWITYLDTSDLRTLFGTITQGQLQIWMEHFTLIFENLKPAEKPKKYLRVNWKSSKVILIFKIRRVRLKNWKYSIDVKLIFWFLYRFQIFKDPCGVFRPYL